MGVVEFITGLHDVIIGEEPGIRDVDGCGFIDRGWCQAHGLIIGDVAPTLALTDEDLGIECRRNDRVDEYVVSRMCVVLCWDGHERSMS